MNNCVFCQIVAGNSPSHKIWEDQNHLAFLSIFPNTEGVTVVITKEHFSSYAFDLSDDVLVGLTIAAKKVAKILDKELDDVGRTALVFEGFGVDHTHAKLFPMHGTKNSKWVQHNSEIDTYFENYEGYISSNDSKREEDNKLEQLAEKIRGER